MKIVRIYTVHHINESGVAIDKSKYTQKFLFAIYPEDGGDAVSIFEDASIKWHVVLQNSGKLLTVVDLKKWKV